VPDSSPSLAAIALGSNLPSPFGSRADNLHEAIRQISNLGQVTAVSSFLDTEPVGYTSQPRFLNAALLLETRVQPLPLLHALLAIEKAMGRRREGVPAKGPRIIDLDLLFFGSEILQTPDLTLPHPALAERLFVLEPLAEIAPEWVHPLLGIEIRQLLARLRPK
jgi:2-amino-4-hydroxy-6-hydroxymethyldihydropteridine diphosphokinase